MIRLEMLDESELHERLFCRTSSVHPLANEVRDLDDSLLIRVLHELVFIVNVMRNSSWRNLRVLSNATDV